MIALLLAVFFAFTGLLQALGNAFVMSQLKVEGDVIQWDPYPRVGADILSFIQQTTSVKTAPDRKVVSLKDPTLFQSPFMIYTGAGKCTFTSEERDILKRYLSGGGFLFVEDLACENGGSFDYSFRAEIKKMFPGKEFSILPRGHAVYRSFYLLRGVGGRKLTHNYLEGLDLDGRTAIVYSQNDVLGAWAKDLFGNYLHACEPGGEAQRWESQKLMINIILYSVTGTYKTDTIHLPFIEDKLKR